MRQLHLEFPSSVPSRLGSFAVVLLLVAGGGWAAGQAVGPIRIPAPEVATHAHDGAAAADPAQEGAAQDPAAADPQAAAPAPAGGHAGHGGGGGSPGELQLWAVQTSALGVVVTDGSGELIYRYDGDRNAPPVSNCTGACAATWQPVAADLNRPPELLGVDEGEIDVVTRPDGRDQLTLDGWPLYRHVGASSDPNTQANGTDGVWFAIRPDGSKAG